MKTRSVHATICLLICWLSFAFSPSRRAAAVAPADCLGDHMVLQRGKPVPIWGKGQPGEQVKVTFAGQTKTATVNDRGGWLVRLDPLAANREPQELKIDAASGAITFVDVLIGDVWIAGGQSNMGRDVARSWRPDDFNLDHPHIRFLKVDSPGAAYPQEDLQPSKWDTTRSLPAKTNAWNVCEGEVTTKCAAVGFFFAHRVYQETGIPQGLLWNAVAGSVAKEWIPRQGWHLRPQLAETAREVDRWYPSTEVGKEAFAAALDEIDGWTTAAEAAVKNGNPFPYPQPTLPAPPNPHGNNRGTTYLYNGRVHPLVPYAIKGILWYQGESDYANGRYLYEIEAMVAAWRQLFACPGEKPSELPFYFVQMQRSGSYMSPDVRDKQYLSYFTIPNAGMAVLMDLDVQLHPGNKYDAGRRLALWSLVKDYGQDIPFSGPIYKSHATEGDKVIVTFDFTYGSLFIGKKHKLEPVEELPDGKLVNLEITTDGRNWVPAKSKIDGERLVVWAEELKAPTHVRYCWKSIADEPFLYNQAALPAGQFNTMTFEQTITQTREQEAEK
jgi:sialate O-acetylesterase